MVIKPLKTEADETVKAGNRKAILRHGRSGRAWRVAHESMKTDDMLWNSLLFDGIQSDGFGGLYENRRCPACQSTLTRRTTPLAAVSTLALMSQLHTLSMNAVLNTGDEAQDTNKQPSIPLSEAKP